MRLRADLLRAVAGALALGAAAPGAAEPDVTTLMQHFAASRGVEARFREEKSLPLLKEPLVSEGLLYYAPPGRLARFTREPEETSLLVRGDRLRMEDSLGEEEVDLTAHPEARRFIDQLLLLFQGDLTALRRDYEVRFDSGSDGWSLVLEPRGLAMRQVIHSIALRGFEDRLDEMLVTGTQGDVTRTTYSRMQTDRPFDAAEQERLFPAEGTPAPLAAGAGDGEPADGEGAATP